MPPHESPPDDYEPFSELIFNLNLNDDEKEENKDLPRYQIVGVDLAGNTVPVLDYPWDLEQLSIPIFGN